VFVYTLFPHSIVSPISLSQNPQTSSNSDKGKNKGRRRVPRRKRKERKLRTLFSKENAMFSLFWISVTGDTERQTDRHTKRQRLCEDRATDVYKRGQSIRV
jgi:hypothetical protein